MNHCRISPGARGAVLCLALAVVVGHGATEVQAQPAAPDPPDVEPSGDAAATSPPIQPPAPRPQMELPAAESPSASDEQTGPAPRPAKAGPPATACTPCVAVPMPAAKSPADPWDEPDPYAGLDHSGTPSLPPSQDRAPEISAEPGKPRAMPDYDGLEPPPATAGEALVWVPRVAFFPMYVVLEYGLRWPLIKGFTLAEKHNLFNKIENIFTFNDGNGGIFPTLFFDFGISPSAGFYFFYDDLFVPGNDLVVQFGFWGETWIHAEVTDRAEVFADGSGTITTRAEFIYRPDFPYYGLGPETRGGHERFMRMRETEVELSLRAALSNLNRVDFGLFYRNVAISGGKDPSIDAPGSPFDITDAEQVPGYGDTFNLLQAKLKVELDSRSPDRVFTPGSGLRVELFSSFAMDPGDVDLRFVRYGGEAAAFWDISGINHVLAVRFYTELLESLGDTPVPLSERIMLGGNEAMRGFLEGRLRGDSAMVVTLDYRYPVWSFLDANLFVSMGNTFMDRFYKLHIKRMMLNWGFGLRSNTSRDVSFDFLVALGTNQFERWQEDFKIDTVRVVFGVNQGF